VATPEHRQGVEALPAWLRRTDGENRLPAAIAILVAVAAQLLLPKHLVVGTRWLLPGLEILLLLVLIAANPVRLVREHPLLRGATLGLVACMTIANSFAAIRLVDDLLHGKNANSASALFATGAAIYLTNVVTFALWFWDLDRGGPFERAAGHNKHPDFLFPQMATPELADNEWEPHFLDYLYVSFTNAVAFSPTDTMPLTRWAKMLMLIQSCIALVTIGLVVARGVNVLN
jgi:uncharacterized membrane protein